MSINRRNMLAGIAAAVPLSAVASTDYSNLDADLFQLEAEFNAAAGQYQAASYRLRSSKMLSATLADMRQKSVIAATLAYRIMQLRAHTPAGILLKLRVGRVWDLDEDWEENDQENIVRASIIADLQALASAAD